MRTACFINGSSRACRLVKIAAVWSRGCRSGQCQACPNNVIYTKNEYTPNDDNNKKQIDWVIKSSGSTLSAQNTRERLKTG